jgi:hypothetical protein
MGVCDALDYSCVHFGLDHVSSGTVVECRSRRSNAILLLFKIEAGRSARKRRGRDTRETLRTDKFSPMVDFPDVDAEGQPTTSVMNPKDALKRMKALPEIYGNLFKSGVVSGIGSNSATGIAPGQNGQVDLRKAASNAKSYRELRATNPEALGLKPRPGRGGR